MPKPTDLPNATGPLADSAATPPTRLLAMDEPPPFFTERLQGRSHFVLVVDHAGARIPRYFGDLGLPPTELQRHIAWDIGSLSVARQVAAQLDAPLVAQN